MDEFNLFYQAAEELDMLVWEGAFGEKAMELTAKRDSISDTKYIYECLKDIFSEPHKTYGIKNTIGITFTLMGLFTEALKKKGQEASDVLAAFWKGTKDVPELECLSAYNEFLFLQNENKKMQMELFNKGYITKVEQKKVATSILTAYSKGVELIGKVLTQLLTLLQMEKGVSYDLYANSQLTIYQKTEDFLKLSEGKYDKLTSVLDRSIRNADSHLNAHYSVDDKVYIMKKTVRGKGGKVKTETFKITAEKMLKEIYPKIGWLIQGFISACMLTVLAFDDKELYKSATICIMDINNDPSIL